MCACCSCGCGLLISLKLFPASAREVKSSYTCMSDFHSCMRDAARMQSAALWALLRCRRADRCSAKMYRVRPVRDRMPGALVKKPSHRLCSPPESVFDTFVEMSAERGKG